MGLLAKQGGESFPIIEAGLHQAICCSLYDLGHQYNAKFDKWSHQALVVWELPDLRIEVEKDGKKEDLPRVISKKYTLSLGDKANLRKDLQSWRGKVFSNEELEGFDLQNILGKNCMIQIIHNSKDGKTYANIGTIIPLIKSLTPKQPENPIQYFSMDDHSAIPDFTPKWIKELIMVSKEYAEPKEDEPPAEYEHIPDESDDTTPF
jgi:hypothetical protein